MTTNGAGNSAHTNNKALTTENTRVRASGSTYARGPVRAQPATKLIAVLASFAMLAGIGFIGLFSNLAVPEASAAQVATRGQPVAHQDPTPVWTKITNQHAVWSEDLDEDGVYWIDNASITPSSVGATTAIVWKAYDWAPDMSTYSVKSVLSFTRDASGNPSLNGNNNLSSMAMARIGGTQNHPEAKLTVYFWAYNSPTSSSGMSCSTGHTPIVRVTSGDPNIYWSCMPSLPNTSSYPPAIGAGGGTGGEADQYTGNIYMTGQEGSNIDGTSATRTTANTSSGWAFLVWNPETGAYSMSGPAQPGDWYNGMTTTPTERAKVFANSNGTGNTTPVAPADFALDADGNVYTTVGGSIGTSATASYNAKMIRLEPARDSGGNILDGSTANPWRYYVVTGFTKDPAFSTWGYGSPASTWGNPFMNGQMLMGSSTSITPPSSWSRPASVLNTSYGTYLMEKLDPMTGLIRPVWSTANSADARSSQSRDNASPQQAELLRGTLYNDANGDGMISPDEKGIPDQTVGLYDSTGKLLSIQTTDSAGDYSFILTGAAGATYYVRPTQVHITLANGAVVNAAQTWGAGSVESGFNAAGDEVWNVAGIVCYNQSAPITSPDGDTCYGAKNPASADPAIGVRGDIGDSAQWLTYGSVTMNTSQAVPTLDFGFTAYGSYGDAAAGPMTTNVPAHITTDPASQVFFGSVMGQYGGPAADDSHASDDGVYVKSYDGVTIPLADGTILAATSTYVLGGDISGNAAGATAKGWVTGLSGGSGANAWGAEAAWNPTISGNTATGSFQYTTSTTPVAGSPTVQFRAQVSPADITSATNASGQYYADSTGGPNWTTPGEIEDYVVQVADSVYRPAVKTTSGSATITMGGQSVLANPAAFTIGKAVNAPANTTASFVVQAPDSNWILTSANVVSTSDGSPAAGAATLKLTPSETNPAQTTVSWTTALGDDVRVELVYGRAPDPNTSSLTLDKDTAPVGGDITAIATIKDASGNLLGNQVVSFDNKTASTVIDKVTCTTNAVESDPGFGTCSVSITSDIAGTYTDELSATVGVGSEQRGVTGSPKTVTFTALQGDPRNSTIAVDKGGPLVVGTEAANTYTVTAQVKDGLNNAVTGQEVRFTVTNEDGTAVSSQTKLSGGYCETTIPNGTCSVTVTSTKAGVYLIGATIEDPEDPGSWVPVSNSPLTRVYAVGEVCPDHSLIAASPKTVSANGVDASTVTVTLMDCYDNQITDPSDRVAMTTTLGAISSDVRNVGDGTYTTTVISDTSGTATVGFSVNGSASPATDTVNFTATAVSSVESSWTVTPTTTAASGTAPIANGNSTGSDYYTVVLTARDANKNALTTLDESTISFVPSLSTVTVSPVTNTGGGTYTATVTTTKAGTPTLSAYVDSTQIASNPGQQTELSLPIPFQAGPVCFPTSLSDPNCQTWAEVVEPNSALADGVDTNTIRVHAYDKDGNPAAATFGLLSLDDAILSASSVSTTDPDGAITGVGTVTATAPTAGGKRVQVNLNGTLLNNPANGMLTLYYTVGSVSETNSTLSVDRTSQTAGGDIVATVTAKDGTGLLLTGVPVTVTVDKSAKLVADGQQISGSYSCVTLASGTCQVTITDQVAENVIVHATVQKSGSPVDITGSPTTVTFVAGPVVLEKSTIAASPTSGVPSNGSEYSTVTVTLRDQYNNLVTTDHIVGMTPSMGAITSVTHNSDGTYSARLTSTVEGTSVVSYTVDGATGTGTASVSFVDTNEPVFSVTNSTWAITDTRTSAASGGQPVANSNETGGDYYELTLTAKDQKGTAMTTLDISKIAFSVIPSTGVVISSVTNNNDGTYTVIVDSSKASDSASTPTASVTYNGSSKVGPVTDIAIPFQAGAVCIPGGSVVCDPVNYTRAWVDPNNALADGSDTDTINVRAYDAKGNPVEAVFTLVSLDGTISLNSTSVSTDKATNYVGSTTATSLVKGTYRVQVSFGTTPVGGPLDVIFVAGAADPHQSSLDVDRTSQTVGDSVAATVTAKDASGNLLEGISIQVSVDNSATLIGTPVPTTYGCVTDSNGTCTVSLTDMIAEDVSVTATVNVSGTAAPITGSPATVTFTADVVCVPSPTVTCDPDRAKQTRAEVVDNDAVANGIATDSIVVWAFDAHGNPTAATFTLSSVDGQVNLDPTSADVTAANNTRTVTGTSIVVGAHDVSVAVGGQSLAESPLSLNFVSGSVCVPDDTVDPPVVCSGNPDTTTRAWVDPNGALADGSATNTIHVQAFDASGHPVDAIFVLSSDADVNLALSTLPVTSGNGKATTTATSAKVGDHPLSVSVNGTPLPDLTLTYVITAVSVQMSALSVDTPVQEAGGVIMATVTAKDAGGRVLEGIPVQISVDRSATLGGQKVSTYECRTVADGTCSVAITDTVAEPVVVTATVNVDGQATDITGSPTTVNFVAGPVDPSQSTISVDQVSRVNDGMQISVVTVTLKDRFGNQVTSGGASVTMSQTLGALTNVRDMGNGTYTANLTSTVAGTSVVGYLVDDATGNGTVTVVFVDTTAPDSPTVISPKPGDQLKDPTPEVVGTAEPGSTVTVTDKDSGDILCTTVTDGDGAYSCTPDSELSDGPHTLVVTASDPSGNISTPTEVPLVIDTIPPTAPAIDVANGTQISGRAEPGSVISVTVPGVADPIFTTADENGDWLVLTPVGAIDNSEVSATATDAAGNQSEPGTAVLDITAPDKPDIQVANASEISGLAEPGSTVTVRVPGVSGSMTTTAGDDGTWSIKTPTGAIDGGTVTATATDPAGNVSPQGTKVLDITAPDVPEITKAGPDGIAGTAEPGSTVTVRVPGVADPTIVTAGPDGKWSIDTPQGAIDGTIRATATDPAGNTSPEATKHLDVTAPDAPVVEATPTQIYGTAEPGSTVDITVPGVSGTISFGPVPDDGAWSIPTPQGAVNGTVSVTATDESGNTSEPGYAELDKVGPAVAMPVINHANATHVAGDAGSTTAGNVITVTFPDGQVKTTIAGTDGSWEIPTPAKADGTKMDSGIVSATSTDPTTHVVSPPRTHELDTDKPEPPRIDVANGTEISGGEGAAEPGATVTVTWPDGSTTPVVVEPNGSYHVDTPADLPDGSVITVTVTDPAGNVSDPVERTVDTAAPDAPIVETANATEVSGTAEPGSTVTVTFPDGTVTTATADSATGAYSVTTPAGMPDGGEVTVTATDEAGNVSQPTRHPLDTGIPDVPTIDRADAIEISGSSEPGSTVTITVPGVASPITVGPVGDDGKWSVKTPSGATDGTVRVTATDPAGNVSGEATRDIDVTAPEAPVVDPSNGTEVTGSGDAGSVITITDENGDNVKCKNADGTVSESVTVGSDGRFVCVPEKVLTPGTSITVVAKDASGLPSDPVTVTIGNVSIEVAYPERHHLDSQTVTGYRFNAGEQVCLVVYSNPYEVGCDAADEHGTVTFTFNVPELLDLGDHTATLTGQSSKLSASTAFTVVNTPEVRTGGTTQDTSDGLLYGVLTAMIAGSAIPAVAIRRL